MMNTIGMRECEKALQIAISYTPEQALKIHLVDEIVEKDDLMPKAEEEMKKWLKIPSRN